MKNKITSYKYTVLFFFIFKTFVQADTIVNLVAEEWPPYNYTKNGKLDGFTYDIVKNIMKDLKINYEIQILPSIRAKKKLDEEKKVMFFTMFRTPEREKKYKWIGPLDETSFYFYKKKGNFLKINTLKDAKKVDKIACRSYGLVYSYLKKEGFTNLDVSPNSEGIYMKVISGRSDLGIGESPVGVTYLLKKLKQPIDILEKTQVSILKFELYIACSKDISDVEILRWQNSLNRMKASGEYDKLYEKYIN